MRSLVFVAIGLLALGCKQRTSETVDVVPSSSASSAIAPAASGAPDDDAIALDPKMLASICAKLTDVPRVAEKCGPMASDAGAEENLLSYSFKATKGAEDQASGLLFQVKHTKRFATIVAKSAADGVHHCENDAHNISIAFVGKPSELAEVSACERLKSIP